MVLGMLIDQAYGNAEPVPSGLENRLNHSSHFKSKKQSVIELENYTARMWRESQIFQNNLKPQPILRDSSENLMLFDHSQNQVSPRYEVRCPKFENSGEARSQGFRTNSSFRKNEIQSNGGIDLCEELYQQLNQQTDDNMWANPRSVQSPLSLQSSQHHNNSKKHSMFDGP